MVRDTKKSTQIADQNGSYHMVEWTGDGCEGNACIVWSRIWLPERIPKNLLARPFLCGFVLTRSQRGAVKRMPQYWRDKQVSRQMQFNNMGGET